MPTCEAATEKPWSITALWRPGLEILHVGKKGHGQLAGDRVAAPTSLTGSLTVTNKRPPR